MFRFLASDGSPQAATGRQRFVPLVELSLPAAAGGTRRWALGDRDIAFGGQTWVRFQGVVSWTTPEIAARMETLEEWTLALQDGDGAWAKLLASGALGPRAGRLGSRGRILLLRELDGALSKNAMTAARGWLRRIAPEEDADGRRLALSFANEAWSLDRDATASATWDAERDIDENATSARFADQAVDIAWGARQGVRLRRA